MKRYIKPCVDIHAAAMTLPVMMSLHDEVGDGQLANDFNFEEEDYSPTTKNVWDE